MFTLFAEAYDQVRRAICFLRWNEGDLDSIAPSLYSGRGNVRRKAEPQPVTPPVTATSAATGVALNGSAVAAPSLPGGDPFMVRES